MVRVSNRHVLGRPDLRTRQPSISSSTRSNCGLALRDASLRDVPQGKADRERACWNIQTNGSTSSTTRRNCFIGSPMVEMRNVTRLQPESLYVLRCSMHSRGEP